MYTGCKNPTWSYPSGRRLNPAPKLRPEAKGGMCMEYMICAILLIVVATGYITVIKGK